MTDEEKRLLVLLKIAQIDDEILNGEDGEINTIEPGMLIDLMAAKKALLVLLGDPLDD